MKELLLKVIEVIGIIGFVGAFFAPDWIVGVNKAMRMGKAPYPKEKKKKKWKWVGIFLGVGLVALGVSCLLEFPL